ncbi:unnamed protein product, partial [Acanthoscelides obtectus]
SPTFLRPNNSYSSGNDTDEKTAVPFHTSLSKINGLLKNDEALHYGLQQYYVNMYLQSSGIKAYGFSQVESVTEPFEPFRVTSLDYFWCNPFGTTLTVSSSRVGPQSIVLMSRDFDLRPATNERPSQPWLDLSVCGVVGRSLLDVLPSVAGPRQASKQQSQDR